MPTISLHDKGRILSLGHIADLPRARELLEKHRGEIKELLKRNGVEDSDLVTGMQKLHDMLMQENARSLRPGFISGRLTDSGEGRTRRRRSQRRRPHHHRTHHRRPHHHRTHHRKPHKKKSHRRKSHKK